MTLDMHDKIFDDLAQLARIAVSYRTYSHGDMAETARKAYALLDRTIRGESTPHLTIARPSMPVGCANRRTSSDGPMRGIPARAAAQQQARDLLHIAVNTGLTDADLHAAGPSVLVAHGTG